MKRYALTLAAATLVALATGCHSVSFSQMKPDGEQNILTIKSLFANSAVKGLTVNGATKTTSQGLRISSGATEPNSESITASASALGELIGSAAGAAVKP